MKCDEKKRGRPTVQLNEEEIIRMIGFGHSKRSVAIFFNVSPHTISKNYGNLFQEYGDKKLAKTNALNLVWRQAEKGNTLALSYILEQFLDWRQTNTVELNNYMCSIKELTSDELQILAQQKLDQFRKLREAEGAD